MSRNLSTTLLNQTPVARLRAHEQADQEVNHRTELEFSLSCDTSRA